MYCKVDCLQPNATRSPVVFIHGFPDSPLMFANYVTEQERSQSWLKDRGIYTIAFPNRFTNPNYAPLSALVRDVLQHEFEQILDTLRAESPTGKVILVAHDWGATCSWRYIWKRGSAGIEKMVALSVGSSFRYDLWEHGLRAFAWLYSALFGSPYFVRNPAYGRFVGKIIMKNGGYHTDNLDTFYKDCYHYWYGFTRLLAVPTDLLGLRYRPSFTQFTFPVLYIRSRIDRIATTAGFEKAMQARPECRFVVFDDVNHWFPEQHSERVLAYIRAFL